MPEATLYYMPTCPFCIRVLDYMQKNGVDIPLKDTSASSSIRQELMTIGGKTQVPCLVVDGKALYESEDIIRWIKANHTTEKG